MLTEFKIINKDFENNTGDVLSFHCFDKKYSGELEKIMQIYKENFIDKLLDKENNNKLRKHYTTNEGQIYPYFFEDLLWITRYILYEKVEKELGIKNIQEQSDKEFIETIKKRIKGLENCSKSSDKEPERKEYYETEYQREKTKLEELLQLQKSKLESGNVIKIDKEIIKEHCKNTLWGVEDYFYDKEDKFNLEEFKNFIESSPKEKLFLKTFLPEKCFDDNDNVLWDIVSSLEDKKIRQFIYGFREDTQIYKPYKRFFLYDNLIFGVNKNCHPLVNWTIFSNFYYDRCAISNDNVFAPVRFILSSRESDYIAKNGIENGIKNVINNYEINIRGTQIHTNCFDSVSMLEFIGFINIKFFHNKTKEFRNWTLFIFKNNDKTSKFTDYITGEIPKFIILNYTCEQVNNGSILARDSVTFEELKDFNLKSLKNELFFYISNVDNKTMFLSKKDNLDKNKFLESLLLKKYHYQRMILMVKQLLEANADLVLNNKVVAQKP
jgi:hypothetical protein